MPTSPTPITTAPDVPDRGDRATFATRAEAWNDYIKDDFVPELNTLADVTYDNAVEAAASATTATTKATEADASADAAALSEIAAAASAAAAAASYDSFDDRYLGAKASDPTTDNDGGALLTGALYFKTTPTVGMRVYNGSAWVAAGVPGTGIMGPGSSTDGNLPVFDGATGGVVRDSGTPIAGLGSLRRSARTSNTQLGAADKAYLIDITSGTFTQTFAAAATLGDGWWCYIRNGGTGDITLDPNSAETIDGLATYIMYPGEVRLVQCDGSALYTVVVKGFSKTFTASGTFTKPPGYTYFDGLLWGAGGGGGKSGAAQNVGGGGGGACKPFRLLASALSATEAVTIGSGGPGRSSAGVATAGGNSTFAGQTAYGGGAGSGNASAAHSGGGGGGSLGAGTNGSASAAAGGQPLNGSDDDNPGFGGGRGTLASSNSGGRGGYGGGGGGCGQFPGGDSVYGGGGGGGGGAADSTGGVSSFGGNGGAGSNSGTPGDGVAPGGGGGGTRTGTTSGAGARGELQIVGVI